MQRWHLINNSYRGNFNGINNRKPYKKFRKEDSRNEEVAKTYVPHRAKPRILFVYLHVHRTLFHELHLHVLWWNSFFNDRQADNRH